MSKIRTKTRYYRLKRSAFFKAIYNAHHEKSVTYLNWYLKAIEYVIRIKQGVLSVSSIDDIDGDIILLESDTIFHE